MSRIRDNWRVGLLVVLLLASAIALFVPGVGLGATPAGSTNLQYGLGLAGGTRIQAPLLGVTATGVEVTPGNERQIEAAVAANLSGASRSVVEARSDAATPNEPGGTVEVFANVSPPEVEAALDAAGVDYGDVRDGVTAPTRRTAAAVIQRKIDASGLSGGTVQISATPSGEYFVVVEVPNQNRSQVRDLVESRGVVEMVARFPGENGGVRNVTVLTQEDITSVGLVEFDERNGVYFVSVSLSDPGAQRFAEAMRKYGFTSPEGVSACGQGIPRGQQYCLVTVLDGRPVYEASMGPDLARGIESGGFVRDQSFVITASNRSEAAELRLNLEAGALPTSLELSAGTSNFVAPALAENFKLYSLVTGIVAVFAVAGVVFIRYDDPRVAAPMVVTALSEVAILLGFAAAVGLALDLSHIAGFIAVIGTGVDDLIIIADEVMAEGDVSSGRVFRNRFRKAFWIIGAAAATTIIAMAPLAFLQLGDLRGFAIVTILGVLVGVLVTRPAYGDILRSLITER